MSMTVRRCSALIGLLFLAACQTPGPNSLSIESRMRLAEAARGNDRPVSLPIAREAATLAPRDAATLAQWATAAEQAGQLTEAAEAQRALMALEGANERRLNAIGRLLLRAGDAAGAADAYAQALNLAPRSIAAASGLGLAQDMAGNRAAAQQAYRQGLAVAPADWGLRTNLGMSLVTSGAPREAAIVLGDAEILATAPSAARHNLALAFAANGQLDRAVRVLRSEMGNAAALSMAQEMAAFARWLTPAGDVPPPLPAIAASPAAFSSPVSGSTVSSPSWSGSGVVAMDPIPDPPRPASSTRRRTGR